MWKKEPWTPESNLNKPKKDKLTPIEWVYVIFLVVFVGIPILRMFITTWITLKF